MFRFTVFLLFALASFMASPELHADVSAKSLHFQSLCVEQTARAERRHAIPRNLLGAIALAESGRWDDSTQENVAWPWTVMAEGRGRYLDTKAQAIAEVRALKRRGITNIDVGCMQINLWHHGDAFDDLESAFDPASNTDYAARFLVQLHDSAGSWPRAASHYHSRTPDRARAYGKKVAGIWQKLNGAAPPVRHVAKAEPAERPSPAPPDDGVDDGGIDDAAAFAAAQRFAREQFRLAPIDHARTSRLNERLKAARAGEGNDARGRDLIAWNDSQMRTLGSSSSAALADARLMPSPQQHHLKQDAPPTEDTFAARRRAQLAAWRDDPHAWRRDPPPAPASAAR